MISMQLDQQKIQMEEIYMATIARLEPFRGLSTLQDQFNRLFNESFRNHPEESALTTWAPSVDIYETPNELVVKADLPDVNEKDIDVRVENNLLTIRGERKFEKSVSEENYLRVERTYGSFSRSFSLPNTVNPEAIGAEYKNGVLTVTLPKREESKPRQVKVTVNAANHGK
jgi:HSP20 family protein